MAENEKKETASEIEDLNEDMEEETLEDTDLPEGDETEEAAEEDDSDASEELEEDAGAEEAADSGEGGKLSGFFRKGKKQKDKLKEEIDGLRDQVKRQMAEFENFRKRSEKEKSAMYDMGARTVVEKILPVVDNFERGLENAPEEGDAFADGVKMIYKQFMTALDDIGVKEIPAQGETFDPNLHNAVMHIDDEEFGENEVVEVLQKGYIYHETVVRHSMVKVAN